MRGWEHSEIYNYYEWNEKNRATAAQARQERHAAAAKAQQELEQVTVRPSYRRLAATSSSRVRSCTDCAERGRRRRVTASISVLST